VIPFAPSGKNYFLKLKAKMIGNMIVYQFLMQD